MSISESASIAHDSGDDAGGCPIHEAPVTSHEDTSAWWEQVWIDLGGEG